jgi:hypothetical protein
MENELATELTPRKTRKFASKAYAPPFAPVVGVVEFINLATQETGLRRQLSEISRQKKRLQRLIEKRNRAQANLDRAISEVQRRFPE